MMNQPPGLGYNNLQDSNPNLNQLAYGPPPGMGYQHYNGGYPQHAQNSDANASNGKHLPFSGLKGRDQVAVLSQCGKTTSGHDRFDTPHQRPAPIANHHHY